MVYHITCDVNTTNRQDNAIIPNHQAVSPWSRFVKGDNVAVFENDV
jgi:hypothetical protein